jgi:hypothetical protein
VARYLFVVLANPTDGCEGEFNDFYSNRHIPDVLDVPGVKSAQRFRLADAQRMKAPSPFGYLAVYEIETDDLKGLADEIARRSGTAAMPTNPYICQDPKFAYFFQPMDDVAAEVDA